MAYPALHADMVELGQDAIGFLDESMAAHTDSLMESTGALSRARRSRNAQTGEKADRRAYGCRAVRPGTRARRMRTAVVSSMYMPIRIAPGCLDSAKPGTRDNPEHALRAVMLSTRRLTPLAASPEKQSIQAHRLEAQESPGGMAGLFAPLPSGLDNWLRPDCCAASATKHLNGLWMNAWWSSTHLSPKYSWYT